MNESDDSALAEEISRLLALTRTFSKSFGIRRARVRNWRLMGIVMELEKAGLVNPRLLREAMKPLIPKGRSTHALHQTQYTYVKEFQNPDGAFLTEVSKPRSSASKPKTVGEPARQRKLNLSSYELSPLFRNCEYKYVSDFIDLRRNEFELGNLILEVGDPRVTRVFKTLLVFQRVHYLPLWLQLVADFNSICLEKKYDPAEFNDWSLLDPTWVVLLSTWKHYLENPKKWVLEGDFNTDAVGWLVFPTGDSVADCVNALSNEKGCKIVLRKKAAFGSEYFLNDEYEEALRRYSRPLPGLREILKTKISVALSSTET